MNIFVKESAVILLMTAFTACGSSSDSQSLAGSKKEGIDPPARTDAELTFEHFGVIREFGPKDTGAVFGIAPSRGTFKITGVTGPLFLGSTHVGQMTAPELSHQFSTSSVPMLQKEKDELLSKYSGASFIYFDHYDGKLCSDQEFHLTVSGSVENVKHDFTFAFAAKPSATGQCQFRAFMICTGNIQPGCNLPY